MDFLLALLQNIHLKTEVHVCLIWQYCELGENMNYLLTLTRPSLVMNEAHFMQMVRWGKEAANLQ